MAGILFLGIFLGMGVGVFDLHTNSYKWIFKGVLFKIAKEWILTQMLIN